MFAISCHSKIFDLFVKYFKIPSCKSIFHKLLTIPPCISQHYLQLLYAILKMRVWFFFSLLLISFLWLVCDYAEMSLHFKSEMKHIWKIVAGENSYITNWRENNQKDDGTWEFPTTVTGKTTREEKKIRSITKHQSQ